MRRVLPLLVLSSLAFAPAPLPKTGSHRRPDAQRLQGKWERTQLYNGAALVPERPGEVTLAIAGETLAFSRNGKEQTKWTIELDPLKAPKGLDLVGLGDSKGAVQHGIYRLEGDTLTYCYSGTARPSSFDRSVPGVFLIVLKRKMP